MELGLRCLL
jgi:hypothetical protein